MSTQPTPITAEQLMFAMEEAVKGVSTLTGMKTELVSQGWSNDGAERLVIAIMGGATK